MENHRIGRPPVQCVLTLTLHPKLLSPVVQEAIDRVVLIWLGLRRDSAVPVE